MFKRKTPKKTIDLCHDIIWPKMGLKRYFYYIYYKFLRIKASAHSLACGFAWGAAFSFTPYVGFHIILACIFSRLSRGNYIAATLGTLVGNPITFPFIWGMQFSIGRFLLGKPHDQSDDNPIHIEGIEGVIDAFSHQFQDLLMPMIIGGCILLPIVFFIFYIPLRFMIVKYRYSK